MGSTGHTSAVAPRTVTWEAFVTRWLLALGEESLASREVERLTLAAAVRAVLPRYDAALTERAETVDGFARTLDLLRRHEVTAHLVEQSRALADDADEGTRTRLRALAEVMADQDRRLAAADLHPAASVCWVLAQAIDEARARRRSPASYGLASVVRWWGVLDVDPSRAALAAALARWLGAHGGRLDVHVVCEPRRMQMPPALDRALRVLEAEESGLELRYGLRDPGADPPVEALQRWLVSLTDPTASMERATPTGAAVALAEAQGPEDEGRWVAARVARWIDEGLGAHEVAVVFPGDDPETRRCVGQALDDARIPWSAGRGEGLLSSPVARALLGLPRMVARGAEREEVLRALAVLQGNAPRAGEPAPWRVSQALRTLGVESLFDTELAARFKHGRRHHQAVVTSAVVASIDALARDLWALAQDGTVAEQAERLSRWIDRAGGDGRLVEESRAVMATADLDPGAQAILRALARDEAGVAGAAALLAELPSIARDAGRSGAMSAGEFGEVLLDLARARALPAEAPGGDGGVQLLDARDAVGRSFAAVVMPGLHEGAGAARGEAALWGDSERAAVAKARKVPLARGGGREESSRVLLGALATATRAVAASAAQHDAGGRARPPAAFFGDLQRASGAVVERVGSDPLAHSRRVPPRGAERVLRGLATRREPPAGLPAGLAAALRSVGERSAVERRREAFFAKGDAPGDAYNGRVDHDLALRRHLELERWADARDPLDTTTLERAARCGYKAFALKVLRIDERPELRETLDEKERGHLLHALLEAGQDALKEAAAADPATRWELVTAALDEAGARFSLEAGQVDAALLEADLRAIRRQVELWLARRLGSPEGWTMLESEVGFGPKHRWPAVEIPMSDGPPVAIRGRIDGVERMGGVLRAVEFKSGRGDGYRRRLQQGALETQFQLVVYAAALERARALGLVGDADTQGVDGTYVGFRDLSEHGLRDALAKPRRRDDAPWDVDALIREGAAGVGRLGDAVRAVVAPLREGRFEPRPRDCQFCQYRSLCRVEAHDELPEEDGAPPAEVR